MRMSIDLPARPNGFQTSLGQVNFLELFRGNDHGRLGLHRGEVGCENDARREEFTTHRVEHGEIFPRGEGRSCTEYGEQERVHRVQLNPESGSQTLSDGRSNAKT